MLSCKVLRYKIGELAHTVGGIGPDGKAEKPWDAVRAGKMNRYGQVAFLHLECRTVIRTDDKGKEHAERVDVLMMHNSDGTAVGPGVYDLM